MNIPAPYRELFSADRENRTVCRRNDLVGNAPHKELGKSGPAMGSNHDQVCSAALGSSDDLLVSRTTKQKTFGVDLQLVQFLHELFHGGFGLLLGRLFQLHVELSPANVVSRIVRCYGIDHMQYQQFRMILLGQSDGFVERPRRSLGVIRSVENLA